LTTYTVRPFQEHDREAIVEGRNKTRPAHHQETVAEWERSDARTPEGEVRLKLCAGEPAIAYLSVVDQGTAAWRKPGVCRFSLWVAREHRSQGIGSALYEEAVRFAQGQEAKRLTTFVTFFETPEPAERFLAKRGFAEVDREVPVMLDLTTFDRAKFTSPAPTGIRFLSYADAGDTQESRHKLYALMTRLDRDIPTNDVMPESPVFEQWVKDLDTPEWDSNALLLAADGDEWIGLSQLGFQEQTNIGWTFLTGVLPEYRGRGIAYALKLRAIDAAIARRCPLITTENHEDNAPMRAINRKLGFVPDAPQISYSKDI
jgi:GNAT superfamily N-acetyltransferase